MIRNLVRRGRPRIDMNMFVLCLWLQSLANVHVIELLAVHVEKIGVAFELWDARSLVEIAQVGYLLECLERLNKGEFIEVAGDDDAGFAVLGKDVGDKVLLCVTGLSSCLKGCGTYGCDFHLFLTILNTAVYGRASIAFDRGQTTLAPKVDVDSKELVLAVKSFEFSSKRFATSGPSCI